MCHRGTGGVLLATLGSAILAASIVGSILFKHVLKQQLRYVPGTTLYSSWLNPAPRHLNVYMLNVTNVDEVLRGDKPILHEVGPYIYMEHKVNNDVHFTDNQHYVYAQQQTAYVFNAKLTASANSDQQLDADRDQFIVPNVLFHGVLSMCANKNSPLAMGCKWFEYGTLVEFDVKPFETVTPNELLFGYQTNFSTLMSTLTQGKLSAKFSLLGNNTNGGLTGFKTGIDNMTEVGEYVMWNNLTSLGLWGSAYANEIRGTSGAKFPPYLDEHNVDTLPTFVDALSRSCDLKYMRNVEVHGVSARRYILPPSAVVNASINPEHAVWYSFGPSGLLNLSAFENGVPVFMSEPHFLHGDPQLMANLTIHSTNASLGRLYQTTIDVEPITGVTVAALKALQTNLYIQPYNGTLAEKLGIQHIRPTYFPVFWVQETAALTPSQGKKMRNGIVLPYRIFTSKFIYIATAAGGLLGVVGVAMVVSYCRRRKNGRWQALPAVASSDF